MNFPRRAFLQFTAGLVGGSLLTPIPWKLADDSAIWSQNWRWRPSPERGEITRMPTTCVLCEGGCGIKARLVNGKRAILLEGNPNHPVNRGGICPLGAAGLQFLYAPYRVEQPMKQTKKRGDATGFEKISWEDALKELGGKLAKLRAEGKASSVACISRERRSSMDALWQQFFTAYGSANLFRMPSQADSTSIAAELTTGLNAPLAFAVERAGYVLSFGANLIEGWAGCGRMQNAFRIWRTGHPARVVQVESRCSMSAAKADRWVAVAPGTEAALALGIAHVMIKENLYDAAFVESRVFGFEDWTDPGGKARKGFKNLVLLAYAPEQVSQRTGLDAAGIRELAREFASQKSAVAVWGSSQGDTPNNIYHDLSFLALNVLKGNLKAAGTISLAPDVPLASPAPVAADEAARKGLAAKRLDLAAPRSTSVPGNGIHAFLDTMAKGGAYPIDLLMVFEANPAYSLPDNQVFQAAADKVGMLVSFSSYMDETALQSDLILPNHMALERYDDVIGLPGAPYAYYAVASPILPPRLQTKNTGDVILQVAKNLGETVATALPWASYEAYLQERVNGLASSGKGAVAEKKDVEIWNTLQAPASNYSGGSDLWKKLTAGACWYDAPAGLAESLETASGKIELACQAIQKAGLVVEDDQVYLPHFAPLAPSGAESEYPLQLVTYEAPWLSNEYLANPPFMMKLVWGTVLKENDGFVELSPQTARSLGLEEGAAAVLKTPQGEAPVRVHLFAGARPGVVYMAQGLGHKAYDQYIQDKGVNANNVVEVQMDPVTGLGTVWATRAQLRRV